MEEHDLDFVLVPAGLLVMAVYHGWLLYQIRRKPARTVVGMNAINRRFWVSSMMEDTQKTGVLAVQTLRNNIMASTLLASTAIMLSSLIAVLMTGGLTTHNNNNNNNNRHTIGITFGEGTKLRYYSHASMLINVPYRKITNFTSHHLPAEYVSTSVNLGSYFWSLGLRAVYFSFPLFLWLFGAIPMFVCSIFLVFLLYFLDVSVDPGWVDDTNITNTNDEETG
ncbi:hypothetical protein M8C21_028064 [Ambrosia artemisiifolia]|uniref:Uncharacterized protein n=1 Tax=Ambrosia artemisiifolia TaxID=4212 RepID=A0AAD5GBQ7_AMBAR|nr:hypothetical protein M8C21_028064 [Ambrosia artemisiifolia]